MAYKSFRCPKCFRLLPATGEMDFAGQTFPVYQCEDCIVKRDIFGTGEVTEMAYTFYVKDGMAQNPDESNPELN